MITCHNAQMKSVVPPIQIESPKSCAGISEFIEGFFFAFPGIMPGLKEFCDNNCADATEGDLQDACDGGVHRAPFF